MRCAEYVQRALGVGLAAAVVGALALAGAGGRSESECARTLSPGDALQEAVNEARAGDVLCLAPGTYAGHVKLEKAVTLKGLGETPEAVRLVGAEVGPPVVWVQAARPLGVRLEALAVADPKGSACVLLGTRVNCPVVVAVLGKAELELQDVRLSSRQPAIGLYARGDARIAAAAVQVHQAAFGVFLEGDVEAALERVVVTGSRLRGLHVQGKARLSATGLTVQGSGMGMAVLGSARVELEEARIAANETLGLLLGDAASLALRGARVEANGTDDAACPRPTTLCNGITVQGGAQLVLRATTIADNADWGVGAVLRRCGAPFDDFQGRVTFEGENEIRDNDASGNQAGKGNPGDHPFRDAPDGQVCLP